MIEILRRLAPIAYVLALLLVVGSCTRGPGEPPDPLPSWSPPSWMHGSWEASGVLTGATMQITAYNVVVEIGLGDESFTFDFKEQAADGTSVILHDVGLLEGQRYYAASIIDGESHDDFICVEVDAITMDCIWTHVTPIDEIHNGPFRMRKLR